MLSALTISRKVKRIDFDAMRTDETFRLWQKDGLNIESGLDCGGTYLITDEYLLEHCPLQSEDEIEMVYRGFTDD